jgi:acyl dehydratase
MGGTSETGKPLPELPLEITRERLNAYCAASGDYNPLHWDDEFAAATQFGGIIAHGMLTLALVSRMMAAAYGRAWPESGSLRTRFKGAAYLGDRVVSRGRVLKEETQEGDRLVTCAVAVVNGETDEELVTGTATVRLP